MSDYDGEYDDHDGDKKRHAKYGAPRDFTHPRNDGADVRRGHDVLPFKEGAMGENGGEEGDVGVVRPNGTIG